MLIDSPILRCCLKGTVLLALVALCLPLYADEPDSSAGRSDEIAFVDTADRSYSRLYEHARRIMREHLSDDREGWFSPDSFLPQTEFEAGLKVFWFRGERQEPWIVFGLHDSVIGLWVSNAAGGWDTLAYNGSGWNYWNQRIDELYNPVQMSIVSPQDRELVTKLTSPLSGYYVGSLGPIGRPSDAHYMVACLLGRKSVQALRQVMRGPNVESRILAHHALFALTQHDESIDSTVQGELQRHADWWEFSESQCAEIYPGAVDRGLVRLALADNYWELLMEESWIACRLLK